VAAPVRRGFHRDDATADDPASTPYQRAQDEWQASLWRRCALAIGKWLEERGRLDQPIASLRLQELEGMAWAAIAEYGDAREEKRRELGLPFIADPTKPDPLDRFLTG
jgi:hypothetical protein